MSKRFSQYNSVTSTLIVGLVEISIGRDPRRDACGPRGDRVWTACRKHQRVRTQRRAILKGICDRECFGKDSRVKFVGSGAY